MEHHDQISSSVTRNVMAFSEYSMIITVYHRSCGKVMFSLVFVHTGGTHVTITQDALDLTVQVSPGPSPHTSGHKTRDHLAPALHPPDIRHGPLQPLVTSSGHHWRPGETCSFEEPPLSTDIWWPNCIQLARGRYASYWNAFWLWREIPLLWK